MPLDSLYGARSSFYYKAGWELKFAWMPHRCIRSGKIIWFTFGYMGTAMYTGPGTPVYEYNWHTEEDHLIWLLKGSKDV